MFRNSLMGLLFGVSVASSAPVELPKAIDFGDLELRRSFYFDDPDSWIWKLANAAYESGLMSFNGASEIGSVFTLLNKIYAIDAVVETGTERGSTTQFFSNCFKEVHSIDLSEPSYSRAKLVFSDRPHVHLYLGSSQDVLRELLPGLKDQTLLFFLDAHWNSYWPLNDELNEISKTHKDNCIVVIDDCKVPGRPEIQFDGYNYNGKYEECSLNFIKNNLSKIFTSYSVHYIIPKNVDHRAKMVVIPTSMNQKTAPDYYHPIND